MDIKITPKKLSGKIEAISSKSDAHRVMIAAALSATATDIKLNILSRDMKATADCLENMGAKIDMSGDTMHIEPIKTPKDNALINCAESGSTLRFLLPVVSALCKNATIVGSGKLPERPLSPLIEELEKNGGGFLTKKLPITTKSKLSSGKFTLPGNISSQYITGLLFALPLLKGDSDIILTTPLQSKGYVDMTLDTLEKFGIKILVTDNGYHIKGEQVYTSPGNIQIEGDWSNSAFWFTADFLGGNVEVSGLDNNSKQSDKAIISILKELSDGTVIDAGNIPDLVPIICVAACGICGKVSITNISRLKLKESDRILSVKRLISDLGGQITATDDIITVYGKGFLTGGVIESFNDHRIAMSAAIASLICKNDVIIKGAEAVNKSYPGFFDDFNLLGGNSYVI